MIHISNLIKEKIKERGFNIVAVHFWNGKKLICVAVYVSDYNEVKTVIHAPESGDLFNDILSTCEWGTTVIHNEVRNSIFPDLKANIEHWQKTFPNHFQKDFKNEVD